MPALDNVYSFDVFDTCISRFYYKPNDLFVDLGIKYLKYEGWSYSDSIVQSIVAARTTAESLARTKSNKEDICFEEIYQEFRSICSRELNFSVLRNLELQLELESIYPLRQTLAEYMRLTNRGEKIVFVSDMYLPTNIIRRMLVQCGYSEALKQRVYVSGEVGLTKRSGNLFRFVSQSEKTPLSSMYHVGDNEYSDVIVPARIGINAHLFEDRHKVGRHERAILPSRSLSYKAIEFARGKSRLLRQYIRSTPKESYRDFVVDSRFLGASKFIQLNGSSAKLGFGEVSAFIFSPLANTFIVWLIHVALARRVKKLFFIARNSQLLFKLAEHYCDSNKIDLECCYIYGSRKAWYACSQKEIDAYFLEIIDGKYSDRSLAEVLSDFSFEESLKEKVLATYSEKASQFEKMPLRDFFSYLRSTSLHFDIVEHFSRLRKTLVEYLRSEGFFDLGKVGLVDVGWHLSSQSALHRALVIENVKYDFEGFYFGVGRKRKTYQCSPLHHSFVTDVRASHHCWLFKLGPMSLIEEVLFPADHGTTSGYTKVGSAVEPQFVETNSEFKPLNRAIHLDAIQFCDLVANLGLGCADRIAGNKHKYLDALRTFYLFPRLADVLPVADIGIYAQASHSEHQRRKLASKLSSRDIGLVIGVIFLRKRKSFLPKWVWFQGSMTLTGNQYMMLGRLLSFVDSQFDMIVSKLRRRS